MATQDDSNKVGVYCDTCEKAAPARTMGEYYVLDCGHTKHMEGR